MKGSQGPAGEVAVLNVFIRQGPFVHHAKFCLPLPFGRPFYLFVRFLVSEKGENDQTLI